MKVVDQSVFDGFSLGERDESWIALGIFDGLHLGHCTVLGECVRCAREREGTACVFTFASHPGGVLGRDPVQKALSTVEERLAGFERLCIDVALVPEFTLEFARKAPEEFVSEILVRRLHAQGVVVGFNYRFGRKKSGDAEMLVALGASHGFHVRVIAPSLFQDQPISSTRIRQTLSEGQIEDAGQMLGHGFTLVGNVVPGAGRGKTIGFPTANLRLLRPSFLPDGVYAARAWIKEAVQEQPSRPGMDAMLYIGNRPTYSADSIEKVVEIHVMGLSENLYGRLLGVQPIQKLRDDRRFDSEEELTRQIVSDIHSAKYLFSTQSNLAHPVTPTGTSVKP